MKRLFTIFPWVLILILGGVLISGRGTQLLPERVLPLVSNPSNSPSPSSSSSSSSSFVRVTRIVDGDTIDLSTGQRLRYIGIDTPESGDCFGGEATMKNRELVLDREVRLEKDVSETDRYKRLLRYVWEGDLMINEELVRTGYAKASTYPPDVKYADRFVVAEREARENKRGLWADDVCKVESASVQQPVSGCDIKGNISTSGDKIYHVPGCGSYNKTTINESAGEHWFCSEDEAVSSGWRKAKNC
ncbi:thermonuclease family protein [Candidatus Microgenomates bacterium]|nr:thermonuclease family protein [Candidatus Microgenomates bacterium]